MHESIPPPPSLFRFRSSSTMSPFYNKAPHKNKMHFRAVWDSVTILISSHFIIIQLQNAALMSPESTDPLLDPFVFDLLLVALLQYSPMMTITATNMPMARKENGNMTLS